MKRITKNKLKQVLVQHELWLESNGERGKRANLKDANLQSVDLSGTNLRGVDLSGANLYYADLTKVDLRDANLEGADLEGADMWHTDLRGTKLDAGVLLSHNLSLTKWLKTDIPWFIQHPGYTEWMDTVRILDK